MSHSTEPSSRHYILLCSPGLKFWLYFQTPTSLPVTISLLKLNLAFKLKQNHQQAPFLPVKASGLLYKHLTEDTRGSRHTQDTREGANREQTVKTRPLVFTPDLGLGLGLAFTQFLQ